MNINLFFMIVSFGLLMIFVLFKPLDIKKKEFVDVPIFEVKSFSVYELNAKGLNDVIIADSGIRYDDRYEFSNINYTDKTKEYISNMKAQKGLYKGDVIEFSGDVNYFRDDGLSFKTQKVRYNKRTKTASTKDKYIAYMGENRVTGSSLVYNANLKKFNSLDVRAIYKLNEEEK